MAMTPSVPQFPKTYAAATLESLHAECKHFHEEEQTKNERLSIALAKDLQAADHDPWPALTNQVPDTNAPKILTEQKLQTGNIPVFQAA